MSVPLGDLLEHVLDGEPALGDDVDSVFRRADGLRRRRTRSLLAAGAGIVAVIVAGGYLLTTTLMPATVAPTAATAPPAVVPVTLAGAVADPVLAVIAPVVDGKRMRIVPRPPERGAGWRQYSVLDEDGDPRGTVVAAVYTAPAGLCFPVLADDEVCARAERADDVEYVRYDSGADVDWQTNQTIARRRSDGRTVAVMATGERDTEDAAKGRPALTGAQVERIATDVRLAAAFGPDERCNGPEAGACPVFKVPVPAED
ncbi:hypothetical protein ACWKSP_06855 [Micromonosporaceae bacterium Da 78-11]